jgi:hypothetical protein
MVRALLCGLVAALFAFSFSQGNLLWRSPSLALEREIGQAVLLVEQASDGGALLLSSKSLVRKGSAGQDRWTITGDGFLGVHELAEGDVILVTREDVRRLSGSTGSLVWSTAQTPRSATQIRFFRVNPWQIAVRRLRIEAGTEVVFDLATGRVKESRSLGWSITTRAKVIDLGDGGIVDSQHSLSRRSRTGSFVWQLTSVKIPGGPTETLSRSDRWHAGESSSSPPQRRKRPANTR